VKDDANHGSVEVESLPGVGSTASAVRDEDLLAGD